jgi:hypothetical protein
MSLVPEHEFIRSTIDAAGAVVAGNSYGIAHLSDQHTDPKPAGGSTTLVAWVRVEGCNDVRLGAATAGIDRTTGMDSPGQPFWGFRLLNRSVYRPGKRVRDGRGAGPDEFELPCTLRLTIDSIAGTLSVAIVGGDDLGVVVDQLPTDEPLHLAVGTYVRACRITLLDGEPTGTAELCIGRVFACLFACTCIAFMRVCVGVHGLYCIMRVCVLPACTCIAFMLVCV